MSATAESPLARAARLVEEYIEVVGCEPKRIVTTRALWNQMWEIMGRPWPGYPRTRLEVDYVPVVAHSNAAPGTMYCDFGEP